MSCKKFIDYYELLGLDRSASTEKIKEKCLQLGEQFLKERDATEVNVNAEKFSSIEQAFAILCDPQERDAYDRAYTDNQIQQLTSSLAPRLTAFKLHWWKQPRIIAISATATVISALGIFGFISYLEEQETERFWIQMRQIEQRRESELKAEQLAEQFKEAGRRATDIQAEQRHYELLNEQRKTQEQLEQFKSEVERKEVQPRLRESVLR